MRRSVLDDSMKDMSAALDHVGSVMIPVHICNDDDVFQLER